MSIALDLAPPVAPAMASDLDRRPSLTLTSTTSNDSPPSANDGDLEAKTPPESPVLGPITMSRCNSATGEHEEPEMEMEIAQEVAPPKAAFVLPAMQPESRGRSDGRRKIGTLSMSRSMGSLRPKSKEPVERVPIAPAQTSTSTPARPKPAKQNSFSAFFRKLVGSSSSSSSSAPKASRVVPVVRAAPMSVLTPVRRATDSVTLEKPKPQLAIDTVMTPRAASPVDLEEPPTTASVGAIAEVDPCDIPLPDSPNPYNIALPPSPSLSSVKELNWAADSTSTVSPLARIKRSISMSLEPQASDEDDEDDDEVGSLSGMGSEESVAISPMPMTPATPVLIQRTPPQGIPQEFGGGGGGHGGQGKVTRSPSRWRESVAGLSTSLPLRKTSRSAGPPPSSYDAYEAQQRSRANNRRSCQPTMHTRSTLAAETREVMDQEQEEMMERFFMS